MKEIRTWFVNALVIVGAFWGGYQYLDTHYAHAGTVEEIKQELHAKIQSDKAYQLRERLWKLEERYPMLANGKGPTDIIDIYRRTRQELKDVEKK